MVLLNHFKFQNLCSFVFVIILVLVSHHMKLIIIVINLNTTYLCHFGSIVVVAATYNTYQKYYSLKRSIKLHSKILLHIFINKFCLNSGLAKKYWHHCFILIGVGVIDKLCWCVWNGVLRWQMRSKRSELSWNIWQMWNI